jgi:hypothetical protein
VPDTFYVEIYPGDQCVLGDPPYLVRFPIFVTHDIVDPGVDSIAGFVTVLDFERTNPDKYCSLGYWFNTTECHPYAPTVQENRSIFRHLPSMQEPQIYSRMMDMASNFLGGEWDFRFVDLVDQISMFWLSLVPTGSPDQRWWEGSRVLLATMTFRMEDTMTLCIDTCFIMLGRPLVFSNSAAQTYIPRHLLPVCESIYLRERGDANGDGLITIGDVLHMLNYLFRQGAPPVSFVAGDANSDDDLGILDPLYLLNYLYKGGPPPAC